MLSAVSIQIVAGITESQNRSRCSLFLEGLGHNGEKINDLCYFVWDLDQEALVHRKCSQVLHSDSFCAYGRVTAVTDLNTFSSDLFINNHCTARDANVCLGKLSILAQNSFLAEACCSFK